MTALTFMGRLSTAPPRQSQFSLAKAAHLPAVLLKLVLFVLAASLLPARAFPAQQELAPTPPMGWASWNHFFCEYNDQTVRDQANALVKTGMRDLGYKYVLI